MRHLMESTFNPAAFPGIMHVAEAFAKRAGNKWLAVFRYFPAWEEGMVYIFDLPLDFTDEELLAKEHYVLTSYCSVNVGQTGSQIPNNAAKVYKSRFPGSLEQMIYAQQGDRLLFDIIKDFDQMLDSACSCGAKHTSFPTLHLHYCAQYLPFP